MFTGNKKIRVKTICLFCDDNDIFVSKAYDSVKKDFYFRPIGGTNEFGEYSEDTLKREISEELGTTIKNIKLETVCENIFTCDGLDGHEIVFIYSAEFVDEKYYERKIFEIKKIMVKYLKHAGLMKKNSEVGNYDWFQKNLIHI